MLTSQPYPTEVGAATETFLVEWKVDSVTPHSAKKLSHFLGPGGGPTVSQDAEGAAREGHRWGVLVEFGEFRRVG